MGFDEEQSKFVHTWVRKGKKRSKHDRKAKSFAKRNTWLADVEDEIAPDAVPEEDVFATEVTAAPSDYGYEDDEFGKFTPLSDEHKARVRDAYDRLDALEEVVRYFPSIRSHFDDDFFDNLDVALSFAEELMSLGSIESLEFIDGLESQVNYLERLMQSAQKSSEKWQNFIAKAEKTSAPEKVQKKERAGPEPSKSTVESEDEDDVERTVTTSLKLPKKDRVEARQSKKKKKRVERVDITAQLFASMPKFPQDFRLSDYSGVASPRYAELDVDKHFMKEDHATGYKTGFFDLVPREGAPLASQHLVVHAHFYPNGRFRSAVKVIPKAYEGLTDGTTSGSSNCVYISNSQALGLGVRL